MKRRQWDSKTKAKIVLSWYSKEVVGHYSGTQATSRHWLDALERGLNRQFPNGVCSHDLHLMSDNGSQRHLGS